RKKEIIEHMWTRLEADFLDNLQELKRLLDLELVDISGEEKEESELIYDLEAMGHSERIKRVHRLEHCLGYAKTKYEYAYNLLHQLHSCLKSQMHIINKLFAGSKDAEKLISHLKQQLELELEIIKKVGQVEDFHTLFLALVKGEHIIRTMDSGEKKLLKRMQRGMNKIFSREIDAGITYEWAITVFNALDNKIHDGLVDGMLEGYEYMDFEFANRPEFVELVRESIQSLRKKNVSGQMINVFVHLFREWYNHGRD
ncbi:hypothetical protein HY491_00560, partial [Candidatus Woesearchaeota archaeon]|nr:hypothetical protein [Candidatus Woesearchaeota archaeon]